MSGLGRVAKIATLGEIPAGVDQVPGLREWLEELIAALDIREGRVGQGTNSRFVTVQDLVDNGIIADGVIR